jgi:hypothetical protein
MLLLALALFTERPEAANFLFFLVGCNWSLSPLFFYFYSYPFISRLARLANG